MQSDLQRSTRSVGYVSPRGSSLRSLVREEKNAKYELRADMMSVRSNFSMIEVVDDISGRRGINGEKKGVKR